MCRSAFLSHALATAATSVQLTSYKCRLIHVNNLPVPCFAASVRVTISEHSSQIFAFGDVTIARTSLFVFRQKEQVGCSCRLKIAPPTAAAAALHVSTKKWASRGEILDSLIIFAAQETPSPCSRVSRISSSNAFSASVIAISSQHKDRIHSQVASMHLAALNRRIVNGYPRAIGLKHAFPDLIVSPKESHHCNSLRRTSDDRFRTTCKNAR